MMEHNIILNIDVWFGQSTVEIYEKSHGNWNTSNRMNSQIRYLWFDGKASCYLSNTDTGRFYIMTSWHEDISRIIDRFTGHLHRSRAH